MADMNENTTLEEALFAIMKKETMLPLLKKTLIKLLDLLMEAGDDDEIGVCKSAHTRVDKMVLDEEIVRILLDFSLQGLYNDYPLEVITDWVENH